LTKQELKQYRALVAGKEPCCPVVKELAAQLSKLQVSKVHEGAVLLVSQGDVILRTAVWEEAVQSLREQANSCGVNL
jgi:hypothetical protein